MSVSSRLLRPQREIKRVCVCVNDHWQLQREAKCLVETFQDSAPRKSECESLCEVIHLLPVTNWSAETCPTCHIWHVLTSVWTMERRCDRISDTIPRMSTNSCSRMCCMRRSRAMKVPVLPTPALNATDTHGVIRHRSPQQRETWHHLSNWLSGWSVWLNVGRDVHSKPQGESILTFYPDTTGPWTH